MEEPLKVEDMVTEREEETSLISRGVGLGICYGSLIGVIGGVIFGNVAFGLSLGAALGVVAGVGHDEINKRRKKLK